MATNGQPALGSDRGRTTSADDAGPPPPDVDQVALRDASAIAERIAADDASADEARQRYREVGIAPLEPDERLAALLGPDEHSLAVRRSVALDRRQPPPSPEPAGLAGDLYLTSRRLVLLGHHNLEIDLEEIEEAALSGETLLLALRDGTGVTLQVTQPRLLRVQIAAARSAIRA
ncbi:MAG: hypothetical protein ACXWMN_02295 [Candidatus Limnocylindria bacterium]